jgi:exopolysaccharide production protein ExoQ
MNKIVNRLDGIVSVLFFILLSSSAFEEWVPKHLFLYIVYLYFYSRISLFLFNGRNFNISKTSLIVALFCLISSLWSKYPLLTFTESIHLVSQTIIIMFISNIFNIKNVFKLLLISGLIIILSSFCTIIMFPEIGINQGISHYGLWEGVFSHKNNLADTLVFYVLIFLFFHCMVNKIAHHLILLIINCMAMFLIYKSGSTTGFVLLIIVIFSLLLFLIYSIIKNIYLKTSITLCILTVFLLILIIIVSNISDILKFFGKDLSFTGRDIVWQAASELIGEKWLVGYGYKGTFVEGSNFYYKFVTKVGFSVGSLHNGYLEVLSYIGILGGVIVFLSFIIYIIRSIKIIKKAPMLYYFPLTFLLYLIVLNGTESSFLRSGNDLDWSFFVYTQLFLKTSIKHLRDLN